MRPEVIEITARELYAEAQRLGVVYSVTWEYLTNTNREPWRKLAQRLPEIQGRVAREALRVAAKR